jgi:hypothetical protein
MKDFLLCRRLYYYKRIKKYDRIVFDIPYFVGRVMHVGIGELLNGNKNANQKMREYYKQEKEIANKQFVLTEEQKEDLDEQEHVTQAMLFAYKKKYGQMLKDVKVLGNEVEGSLQVNDKVVLVFKLDNLLSIRGKKVLHELKTSKYITPDYVKSIQTDFQTATYFYAYNLVYDKSPIKEILYDIIRKPSIRQKKGETYQAYLSRLDEWYEKPDDMSVFYAERFSSPKISRDDIFNTIEKVGEDILRCKQKEDYYQDYDKCHGYYGKRCPYYELCHEGGETKENLVLYQIGKSYRINK